MAKPDLLLLREGAINHSAIEGCYRYTDEALTAYKGSQILRCFAKIPVTRGGALRMLFLIVLTQDLRQE